VYPLPIQTCQNGAAQRSTTVRTHCCFFVCKQNPSDCCYFYQTNKETCCSHCRSSIIEFPVDSSVHTKMTSPSVGTSRISSSNSSSNSNSNSQIHSCMYSNSNSHHAHSLDCASNEIRSNDVLCGRGKVDHGTLGWLGLLRRHSRSLPFPIRLLTSNRNSR
jgi:hypothetical protein